MTESAGPEMTSPPIQPGVAPGYPAEPAYEPQLDPRIAAAVSAANKIQNTENISGQPTPISMAEPVNNPAGLDYAAAEYGAPTMASAPVDPLMAQPANYSEADGYSEAVGYGQEMPPLTSSQEQPFAQGDLGDIGVDFSGIDAPIDQTASILTPDPAFAAPNEAQRSPAYASPASSAQPPQQWQNDPYQAEPAAGANGHGEVGVLARHLEDVQAHQFSHEQPQAPLAGHAQQQPQYYQQPPAQGQVASTHQDSNFADNRIGGMQAGGAAGMAVMHEAAAHSRRGGRAKLLIALLGIVGLGGGLGLAWTGGYLDGDSKKGGAPLVRSNANVVKVRPKNPGGKNFPHANKSIYGQMQGKGEKDSARLVPRKENVFDPTALKPEGIKPKDTSRLRGRANAAAAPAGTRRVRTLTVRPDGTIVRPSATPQRPQFGVVGGMVNGGFGSSDTASKKTSRKTGPQKGKVATSSGAVRRNKTTAPLGNAVRVQRTARTPSAAQIRRTRTASAGRASPVVRAKPKAKKPVAAKPRRVASRTPVNTGANSGGYVVQLSSRRSETEALSSYANLQQKYPSILSDFIPLIQRADLGSKGVWYRLRVGPLQSKGEASNVCGKLKSAGWNSCLVRGM